MPQLYCQLASRPNPWLLGRTSAGLCTLQTACPLTVTYSGGSPAADTIAAGSAATVYGGSAATFDASADVWVVLTTAGSGALQVAKEADLATVTGDWAGLARVVQHAVEPYQPQAYLASGGLGGAPSTTTAVAITTAGTERVYSLGVSPGSTPPTDWQTSAFDDSAWSASVAETHPSTVTFIGSPPAGAQWVTVADGNVSNNLLWLLRKRFTIPPGLIAAATLLWNADDTLQELWVNGTQVTPTPTSAAHPCAPNAYALDTSLLLPGATNVFALRVINDQAGLGTNGPTAWTCVLSVTQGASGGIGDPGGHEGDLLYAHSGTWTRLPIGAAGQELTVVSGDPAWATPAASGVTSIAVAVPSPLASAGGPITSSGTITLSWASGQTQNRVLASPNGSSGALSLRALVGDDIPVDSSTIVSSAGTIKGNYQAGSGVSISGNTISATGSGGSVTSVALTMPGIFSVSGSPVTTSGTLAVSLATQSAHAVFAGPASGSAAAPTFRALQGSDLPAAAGAGGKIHAHGHFI